MTGAACSWGPSWGAGAYAVGWRTTGKREKPVAVTAASTSWGVQPSSRVTRWSRGTMTLPAVS